MASPEVRIPALGALAQVPIVLLKGFIESAFTGDVIDTVYVEKHKDAYTAFLCKDAYITVQGAVKSNAALAAKAKKLHEGLLAQNYSDSAEYDLASLITSGSMAFKSSDDDVLTDDVETEPTVVLDEDDKLRMSNQVTAVMAAYKVLFSRVYQPKSPLGAYGLCAGHQTYKKGAIYTYSPEKEKDAYRSPDIGGISIIRSLYVALGFKSITESSKWSARSLGAADVNYYPVRYMGRFANKVVNCGNKDADSKDDTDDTIVGVIPKQDAYWRQLAKWVEKKLLSVYEEYMNDGDMDEAWIAVSRASRNLVTSFVVEECDARVSQLLLVKVCAPSLEISTGETAMAAIEKNIRDMGIKNVAVRAITATDSGDFTVFTVAVALNDIVEADAPSFAYQIWDEALSSGAALSEVLGTHNVIFGRHADGVQRSFNLADQNGFAHNMAVIAGAGSGKGLTTLCTLGSAAARGEPIFYLDCKPEMSSILRDFAAKAGMPGRVYAYDGAAVQLQLTDKVVGSNPSRFRPFETPFGIELPAEVLNGLAMCKAYTLLLALMKYVSVEEPEDQKARWDTIGYAGVGGLAVFDELQLLYSNAWEPMMAAIAKIPGAKEKDQEYANYVKLLKSYVSNGDSNIGKAANALLRYSPISTMSLFQDFKFVTDVKPVFQGLFRKQNLVGLLGDSGNDKTRKVANPRLYDRLLKRQWVVATVPALEVNLASLSNPIKPYLVFGTPRDVEKYTKTDAWNALPPDYRDTIDMTKLDFIGLLRHDDYQIDLVRSLACGYDMAQNFLNIAGFGGSVEDYITSLQPFALINYDKLYQASFANFARIKSGELQYENPPPAGTGSFPAVFAVGGSAEGDYVDPTNVETPDETSPQFDDLDEDGRTGGIVVENASPLTSDSVQTPVTTPAPISTPFPAPFPSPFPNSSSVSSDEVSGSGMSDPEKQTGHGSMAPTAAANLLLEAERFAKECARQKEWASNIANQCDKESAWDIREAIAELRKRYSACDEAVEGLKALNEGNLQTGHGTVDTQLTGFLNGAEKDLSAIRGMIESLQNEMGYEDEEESDGSLNMSEILADIANEEHGKEAAEVYKKVVETLRKHKFTSAEKLKVYGTQGDGLFTFALKTKDVGKVEFDMHMPTKVCSIIVDLKDVSADAASHGGDFAAAIVSTALAVCDIAHTTNEGSSTEDTVKRVFDLIMRELRANEFTLRDNKGTVLLRDAYVFDVIYKGKVILGVSLQPDKDNYYVVSSDSGEVANGVAGLNSGDAAYASAVAQQVILAAKGLYAEGADDTSEILGDRTPEAQIFQTPPQPQAQTQSSPFQAQGTPRQAQGFPQPQQSQQPQQPPQQPQQSQQPQQPQQPPQQPQQSRGFFTGPDGRRYFDAGAGNLVPILTTPDGKAFFADTQGNLIPADGRFAVSPGTVPGVYEGRRMASTAVTDSGARRFGYGDDGEYEMADSESMGYAQPASGPFASLKRGQGELDPKMSNKKLERAFSKRWEALLRAGATAVGGRDSVTLLNVEENKFSVNNHAIDAAAKIAGAVSIADLVDFRSAFKYYKNLKWLSLDAVSTVGFDAAFSSPEQAFTLSKTLQMIRFVDSSGRTNECSRANAARYYDVYPNNLSRRVNSWSAMAAQVNQGHTSSFCKPGSRLIMADWTKRLAAGAFGANSTWSRPRRAGGAILMFLTGAGTVVTGGVQAARAAVKPKY